MNNDAVKFLIRFIVILGLQVLLFNHLAFNGYITPFIYPLFILLLPFDIKGWSLLLWAFLLGISIDTFSNSLGMHASALVLIAFLRPWVINLISNRTDFDPGTEPQIVTMGFPWMFLYTLLLIFIHHLYLFIVEIWGFQNFLQTLTKTVLSSVASVIFIMLIHLLAGKLSRTRRNLS